MTRSELYVWAIDDDRVVAVRLTNDYVQVMIDRPALVNEGHIILDGNFVSVTMTWVMFAEFINTVYQLIPHGEIKA